MRMSLGPPLLPDDALLRKLSATGFRPMNLQAPGITRDQRPSVYSGHPPSISLSETPK